MAYLTILTAYEMNEIDAQQALELSGCWDLFELHEWAIEYVEQEVQRMLTVMPAQSGRGRLH